MPAPTREDPLPATRYRADLDLIQASLEGDARAQTRLAERLLCVPRILAVLNRRGGHPFSDEELADVVQDVLEILWRKRDSFAGRAKLETWAYRVAALEMQNARRRVQRRAQRRRPLSLEHQAASPGRSEAADLDQVRILEELLERLGPPDSEVIRQKHFEELSFSAIGCALDTSPNTVKFWYYRGMEKLRRWLGHRLQEEAG